MNACRSDACAQGRTACPCPDACRIPDMPPIKQFDRIDDAVLIVALTVLASLSIALLVFVARNPYLFVSIFF